MVSIIQQNQQVDLQINFQIDLLVTVGYNKDSYALLVNIVNSDNNGAVTETEYNAVKDSLDLAITKNKNLLMQQSKSKSCKMCLR